MEKQIFKTGDRVFIIELGWGVITYKYREHCRIKFDIDRNNNNERKIPDYLVSFTEYTLQGNSQERPIDYNDYIGKWGKFTSEYGVFIDKLESFGSYGKNSDKYFFRAKGANKELYEFIPLTEEQIKILKLQDDNKK